jgi:hypothetical protein
MAFKAKLSFGLGVALAPWLFTMPASAQDPPDLDGLAPTAIVTLNPPQIVGGFDIGWVDAKIGTYLLAASRLLPTGLGPASNPGIVVVDTTSLLVTTVLGSGTSSATTPFAGSCANLGKRDLVGFGGPNGVTLVKRGQGKSLGNAEVWAGNGPIVSPACPINPNTGLPNQFTATISGTTLTLLTKVSFGTLAPGQTLVGTGVAPGTTIVLLLSGPGQTAGSKWTVSKSQTVIGGASFNGSFSGNVLTASSVTGTIAVGQVLLDLDGGDINPATITVMAPDTANSCNGAPCTGTGGAGTYALSAAPGDEDENFATTGTAMSAFTVTIPSDVVVFDYKTGNLITTISTGGKFRADELCFSPQDDVVFVANDEPGDNFGTFIDIKSHKVIQTMKFDGTDPNAKKINAIGLEQCQYNPRDGKIYFNIPDSVPSGGTGPMHVPPGGGHTVRFSNRNATFPFFTIEADFNTANIIACAPAGLAVGPAGQLAEGCGGTAGLIISDGTDATAGGSTIAILPGLGGIDEDWYNPGNNHYYYGNSNPGLLKAADAGNLGTAACTGAGCPAADVSVPSGSGSHSVAADEVSNNVFVPIRAGSGTVCGSFTASGCIAIYQGTNDADDISAGNGNGNGSGTIKGN